MWCKWRHRGIELFLVCKGWGVAFIQDEDSLCLSTLTEFRRIRLEKDDLVF